jgi:hypothetical protein
MAPTFFHIPVVLTRREHFIKRRGMTKIHIYYRVDWLMIADVSEDVSASVFRVLVHPHHSDVGITDFSILHIVTDCLELHEYPRLPSYVSQCRKDITD